MRKVAFIAVLLAIVVHVTPAWCQGKPGPGGPGGPGAPSAMSVVLPPPAAASDNLANTLGLTTETAAELKTALTTSDTTIQPLLKTAGDSAKALRDALFASTYDSEAITDLANTVQTAESAVITASLDVWTQLRSILTAEQIEKLQAGPGCAGPPPSGSSSSGTTSGTSSSTQHR